MQMILELQKLDVPVTDTFFGSSCSSSVSNCCNGKLTN